MEEFSNKQIDGLQLAQEIAPLNPPGFKGEVLQLARRQNAEGKWVASAPYILVKCDPLTTAQRDQLAQAIVNHMPTNPPKSEQELAGERLVALDISTVNATMQQPLLDLLTVLGIK